jgi:melibiose permease/lactose/raffinose/galactose permease
MEKRNKYFFGLGTVGRDMFYSLESMYLLFYLTEVRQLSGAMLAAVGGVLTFMRIFDAVNDPITSLLIDNTRSRFGKFKPWMLGGGIIGSVMLMLMFTDLGISGAAYVIIFAVIYLLWDLSYGVNDIAYWTLLPALTLDQKQREKTGAFARICANIGMYIVVVGILPVTNMLSEAAGSAQKGWWLFALIVCSLSIGFLCFTLFGVKEDRKRFKEEKSTSFKELLGVIFKNDQLLYTAIGMILFMVGYCTTTSFGTYFFKYAYGNEGMYSVFAGVLGVAQLSALLLFPLISKKLDRRRLYTLATVLVIAGYIIFFVSPMNMLYIGLAGVLIFIGQAFIQLLMLMFLADSIEYGQWKLGRRNESITFSVQPLINKLGAAIATGIVTITLLISKIDIAESAADVTAQGILIMKLAMLIFPLLAIVAGFFVYIKKYKIDSKMYGMIINELRARGDIK